jgi:hypothetical protein
VLILALALLAAHATSQVRPGGELAACVDPAARENGAQWLRIVPADEVCGIAETRMSVVLLRTEPFTVTPPAPARTRARAPVSVTTTILEADPVVPNAGTLLIVTSVLAQNDRAHFAAASVQPSGPELQHVQVRCWPVLDGQSVSPPVRLRLSVLTPGDPLAERAAGRRPSSNEPSASVPDALGSSVADRVPVAAGPHHLAITCTVGEPVQFLGQASLVVLLY